ncbi:similar to RIKEN cDNA 1810055G02, isoform CRA_a [Rattus norvegicus]|uniref:Uncharacterized protein C11orf24 homolog n=2 Tax=Rattus norvegicus TaxID=10116 RepID=CK024_RAT|nr:uncharacterized protein C11orf24 homolog precursor [Rattus norvegicus]Q4V7A5.1 RecName: Full=Uncharacterized protein C11orf24 homolog; Flags: Precursor [Rattus norvegicus]AAH98053.1 Similar to RIKEN cDNA 1810055G02 [Rattus norvegicus]EDM12298.1 similar to RIKEN cDNA 1810055G02, isoform CRA_a [Rattus norvegicus]EDM12299.1 similar to RIKEN cDNA 1810055G02, isoform CRA_a [Rattus norvegicus]|eukprot:NP_001020854.1 uncharacterized protein C11orf24 homolog precursor [Rattus norvegicus]
MWTALVLVWISSVPLSRSHTVPAVPRHLVTNKWPRAGKQNLSGDAVPRADNTSTLRAATVPPAPVTLTTGTWAATLNSTRVTAETTPHGTNTSTPTTREGTADSVTSRILAAPTSSSPSSVRQTLPTTIAGLPSLSTPRAEVPRTNASVSPRTAIATTVAPHTGTPTTGTVTAVSTVTPASGTVTAAVGTVTPAAGTVTAAVGTVTPAAGTVTAAVGTVTPAAVGTVTAAVGTVTSAAGTINTSDPHARTLSPAKSTPTNTSSRNPIPTSGAQTQGTTIQVTTDQPVHSTAGRPTPSPSNTTLEPNTPKSVASTSSAVVTTTQVQTKEPSASTVPVLPTSMSPEVEATSPTTQPSPLLPTQGTGGPGILLTTEQVGTKATAGTASAGPTSRSSGDVKVPTTASCQLSTQGQYLVVTTDPLTPSLVNKMFLLVVLIVGVTLFIAVLMMFALQAYESYKKKDYTQVDYLINGMYADSEM